MSELQQPLFGVCSMRGMEAFSMLLTVSKFPAILLCRLLVATNARPMFRFELSVRLYARELTRPFLVVTCPMMLVPLVIRPLTLKNAVRVLPLPSMLRTLEAAAG